jgi:hypothetical protein
VARSAAGAELTRQHRAAQQAIRAGLLRDLLALWAAVQVADLAGTIGRFTAAAAVLVRARYQESAETAEEYVTEFRTAEGAAGALTILLADPPAALVVAGLVRGAALSGVLKGRQRGFSAEAAARNGFVKASGTASNLALDGGRQVVTDATAADRASTGRWQRVAGGSACAFCAMLASRGPAFEARSAKFEAHPGCSCSAEPVFEGSKLPDTSARYRDLWSEAQRDVLPDVDGTTNPALTAFRRLLEARV